MKVTLWKLGVYAYGNTLTLFYDFNLTINSSEAMNNNQHWIFLQSTHFYEYPILRVDFQSGQKLSFLPREICRLNFSLFATKHYRISLHSRNFYIYQNKNIEV